MDRERTLMSLLSRLEALSTRERERMPGETGASGRYPDRPSATTATGPRRMKTWVWHVLGGFVRVRALARNCSLPCRERP
jgi:hypothetical protein